MTTAIHEHPTKAERKMDEAIASDRAERIIRACTIMKPARELYDFWRNPENLTRVSKQPVTITRKSETESHWVVPGPAGRRFEWDAVITEDQPDELIAWHSLENAEVTHTGSVRFAPAPGDEGTEVTVVLEYDPPGGKILAHLTKLSSDAPGRQVAETLRRFKALMEAGEIPTIEGQSAGRPQRKDNP